MKDEKKYFSILGKAKQVIASLLFEKASRFVKGHQTAIGHHRVALFHYHKRVGSIVQH
jgi:hypothetical protein